MDCSRVLGCAKDVEQADRMRASVDFTRLGLSPLPFLGAGGLLKTLLSE
jgi:hypothetical protein